MALIAITKRKEGRMRRITTAISAAALSLSMALGMNFGVAQAATPGYDSAYQFESAFLSLKPGDSGTFSVFFANTGTASWTAGSGSQVNLAVCAADKVTCNVTSAQAAWANGWLSSTAYATHTKSVVVPGDFSAFTYNVKVPAGTTSGTYRFNGDLVVSSTGDRIHPEGYYQDGSVSAGAGGTGITVTLDSATPNQRVRVVMWQDLLNNGQIDLSTAGSKPSATAGRVYGSYDVTTDGQIGVSGRKFYFGAQGAFGAQFAGNTVSCDTGAVPAPTAVANSAPVWRSDSSTSSFSAGPTSASSLRFTYDSND